MAVTNETRSGGDSDITVLELLSVALDEIRWKHPTLRVTCGAFVGPGIHILASSQPPSSDSLAGVRVVGRFARDLADALRERQELVVDDVRRHELGDVLRSILGEKTHATVVLALPAGIRHVGFLALDAAGVGEIGAPAIARLHEAVPSSVLAIMLDRERKRSQAHGLRVEQLSSSMCRQTVRQREAGVELQRAVVALHRMVDSLAPGLDPSARIELGTVVRRCAQHVDAAVSTLAEAGAHPPIGDRPPELAR